ncbi:MAG TPA: GNAT family protein [Jatrophihabitans sp.]|nr:GNAT family protein [Jatrophihabitans sp.]
MNTAGTTYVIRVDGHLDDHWSAWLGELDLTRSADGSTTVTVSVADQAQLHGVLGGLRDIGAVLTELRTTGAPTPVLQRPLHTERLTLRPAIADDVDPTWKFRQLDSVNEWLTGCPADLDGYRELFCDPARLATTVIVTLGHHPAAPIIGDFMLRREDAWAQLDVVDQARGRQAELGWVLDPGYTGHGYATEAVREMVRYCFQGLGVRRVTANCFLDNDTSWRLMERVGMRRELHAVRESLHRSGQWLDTVGYAILKEDWSGSERRSQEAHLGGIAGWMESSASTGIPLAEGCCRRKSRGFAAGQ